MLIALIVVMAGVLLLTVVFNNRREPSRWYREGVRTDDGGLSWVYAGDFGSDSGSDCGSGADGAGGGCDGGGGGGGDSRIVDVSREI